MKYSKLLIIIALLMSSIVCFSKKKFTFDEAMKFKNLNNITISEDGSYLAFLSNPDRGDGEVQVLSTTDSTKKFVIERGAIPFGMSKQGNVFACYQLQSTLDILNAKSDKDKSKKDLYLIHLDKGSNRLFENVSAYQISNDGNWLIYKKYVDKQESKDEKKKKPLGDTWNLHHINSNTDIVINNVTDYLMDSTSTYLFYCISDEKGKKDGLYYKNLKEPFAPEFQVNVSKNNVFSNFSFSNKRQLLSYSQGLYDSTFKVPSNDIYIYDINTKKSKLIIKDSTFKGYYIPYKNKLEWNTDGTLLYFGMKPESERYDKNEVKAKFTKDNLFDYNEIRKETQMYLWHWKDDEIVTKKKKSWDTEKDKFYYSIYNVDSNQIVFISDQKGTLIKNDNTDFAMLYKDSAYKELELYNGSYIDVFSVNQKTGLSKLVATKLGENASLSTTGKYIAYYKDLKWFIYENQTSNRIVVNDYIKTDFHELKHDVPEEPGSCGYLGWSQNDSLFYLYDNYKIWKFNPFTKLSSKLFDFVNETEYRVKKRENTYSVSDNDTLYVSFQNKRNKESGLLAFNLKENKIMNKVEGKYYYRNIFWSKSGNSLVYQRENQNEFYDLHLAKKDLSDSKQFTNLHNEIKDYEGSNIKIIDYKTSYGDSLQAYIMLPESYKVGDKLPVLIYFYERMSDNAYQFNLPALNHRPCYQVYLNEGYAILFPDVKYYNGSPGDNALSALNAATKKIIDIGLADSNKIAIWGHSWSGYQGAYISTKTNLYKAIVSGAPVGNMTSAYSGIRTESGRARQFQYEKQQSRIGGNLIDSLNSYIRNSPVFFANKMEVPLLIAHGDLDEAVPFSQGVELHLAMKRFNKNCILLHYENEPHHLKKYANKVDYAIRMKEFYDHYILGKKAPDWLLNGIEYKGDFNK